MTSAAETTEASAMPEEADGLNWDLDFAAAEVTTSKEPGASATKSRRAQKRAEKAIARAAHDKNKTRELRAVAGVLQALPQALPGISKDSELTSRLLCGFCAQQDEPAGGNAQVAGATSSDTPKPGQKRKATPDADQVQNALEAAEEAFRIECPYGSLPQVFAPPGAAEIVKTMIDRPPKYQEKYVDQEVSILAKVWGLAQGNEASKDDSPVAVIDIGAGNGSLALLASVLLGGYAVLIDHTLPPEPLRVEDKVPEPYKSRVLRVTGDVADLDAQRELEPLLERHGICRVVIIAKHLCGVGTDLALQLVNRWCQGSSSEDKGVCVLGAVMATCCGHKIGKMDRTMYAALHSKDAYLMSLTGDASTSSEALETFLGICTPCISWRTTAGALQNRITPAQVKLGDLFEDAIQQPRLNLLKRLFPSATEVAFVPHGQSPQNRCLVAGTEAGVRLAASSGEGEAAKAILSALAESRSKLVAANGGAIVDLKPHGFVSTKYDYDGN
eukprot:TRINITY_DN28045_c0_g1_i1.p1 TRINITY_DN28045_c0_g1~~TRINITY_DN28045_c0_g1_i1.p1  ORF type:complete len:515 (+),score=116.97 TRINITY_DN28045_c0_g1_i1:45-1547(+)